MNAKFEHTHLEKQAIDLLHEALAHHESFEIRYIITMMTYSFATPYKISSAANYLLEQANSVKKWTRSYHALFLAADALCELIADDPVDELLSEVES